MGEFGDLADMGFCILDLTSPVTVGDIIGLSLSSFVKMGVNVKISCLALLLLFCQLVIFWLQIRQPQQKVSK